MFVISGVFLYMGYEQVTSLLLSKNKGMRIILVPQSVCSRSCEWIPSIHFTATTMADTGVTLFHQAVCVCVACKCVKIKILTILLKAKSLYQWRGAEIWKETLSLIWFRDGAMMVRLHILYDLVCVCVCVHRSSVSVLVTGHSIYQLSIIRVCYSS